MMDWTDRHCRYFLRQVSREAFLYTEMITTGALLHGEPHRHLAFHPSEHPIGVQLGGSEPHELAACARLAERYGYDEINLNIGCPSERVQHAAFGACLMAEPALVADCVRAIRDAACLQVTVKHRLGIDRRDDYGFVRDFVGTVSQAGCRTFFVHARIAVLKGLSPKQNREVPPLNYEFAHRLKRDFPVLEIVLNGGIRTREEIARHRAHVDGVMIGRAAYHDPWLLSVPGMERAQVVRAMYDYALAEVSSGTALRHITRHMLGLYHGERRARLWRQMLSDPAGLARNDPALLLKAADAMQPGVLSKAA